MNGYIGRENFERFKIQKEFANPCFPFKTAEQTEEEVMDWIEKNLTEMKAAGVFGMMNTRVLAAKPIFISQNIQRNSHLKTLTNTRGNLTKESLTYFHVPQPWRWVWTLAASQRSL